MPLLNVTNEEAALLRRVLDQFPQSAGNPRIRQDTERSYDDRQDFQAPEVYIALPPEGGIPALTRVGTPAEPSPGDTPGSAECDIYNIIGGDLVAITGMSRTVYNLSTTAIPYDWITVFRTKYGFWIAAVSGAAADEEGCDFGIPEADLTSSTSPSWVLGYDGEGCLVKIPVLQCNQPTGT